MGYRRLSALIGSVSVLALALLWPATSAAVEPVTGATVSARVTERTDSQVWTIELRWDGSCQGTAPDNTGYQFTLELVDLDTGERIYVSGGPQLSPFFVTEIREAAGKRERHLRPELTINCYQSFPLEGGNTIVVTGDPVTIPRRYGGGGSGGGGGGGGPGSGGGGDPTAPVRAGGCLKALLGTNGPDTLTGNDDGEVIIGFGGKDRLEGLGGHDCLLGEGSSDRLDGGPGSDRLTGGRGKDTLIGGPELNAYDAGPGNDDVNARNGKRELVRCGSGQDVARVDDSDRTRGCERVRRPR